MRRVAAAPAVGVRSGRSLLGLVFLATATMGLNATMMNVALPQVATDLRAGGVQSSWFLLVYGLVSTVLLAPFGHLADIVDRKWLFLAAVFLVTGGGLLVAAAPTPPALLAGRVVQAVGAALLLTNAAVVLAGAFPGKDLGRALGVYLAGFSTGHVVGPLLAGVVTTFLSWRWLFLLNAPLGAAALVWGLRSLPRRAPGAEVPGGRLDLVGSVSLAVGLTGLLLALSRAPHQGWRDPVVLAGLGAASLTSGHLLVHLGRSAAPVVDLDLFRDKAFTIAFVTSCVVIWPRLVTGAVVALYVQSVDGGSALRAAAVVAPLAVAVTVASLAAGRALRGRSEEAVAMATILLTAVGVCCLLGSVGSSWGVALQATGVTLVGLGSGLFGAVSSSMIVRLAPPEKVGRTNALRTLGTNGSYAIGLAVGLSIVASGLSPESAAGFFAARTDALDPQALATIQDGYRVFWALVLALLLASAAATMTVLDGRSGARHAVVAPALDPP